MCKYYLLKNHIDLLVVMETRVDPNKLLKQFNKMSFDGFEYTDVRGYAGGIAMGLKMNKIKLTNHQEAISIYPC